MNCSFVGDELIETIRKMFPLSAERKDTFIGGLSIGGFGTLSPVFVAVGIKNMLFDNCKGGVEKLKQTGVDVTFITDRGGHEWDFWDKYIEIAIH